MGLNPRAIRQSAFAIGGLFLGLAALVYITQIQFIEPARLALGFELQVIGAVILGGTNIFGGEGSYAGTALGALFLYLTSQWLTYAGVSPYFQEAITGAVIIAVIGMDCALPRPDALLDGACRRRANQCRGQRRWMRRPGRAGHLAGCHHL